MVELDLRAAPVSLNDHGQVLTDGGVWDPQAGLTPLAMPQGVDSIEPRAFNNNGWVVGQAYVQSEECGRGVHQPMVWRADGTLASDGAGDGGPRPCRGGDAYDINDNNVVIGDYSLPHQCDFSETTPVSDVRYFRWKESGLVDLGRLGTPYIPLRARINNRGAIAFELLESYCGADVGVTHTYLRDEHGNVRKIEDFAIAALKDGGAMAGDRSNVNPHSPIIWSAETGVQDIDPERRTSSTTGMNNSGHVVGWCARGRATNRFSPTSCTPAAPFTISTTWSPRSRAAPSRICTRSTTAARFWPGPRMAPCCSIRSID